MREVDVGEVIGALGFEPLELRDGDVVVGAIVILKLDNADADPSVGRALSTGLDYWTALGMAVDTTDDLRAEGRWEEE